MNRRAGLLLHPTSLPGPYGIGDIGPSAKELLAWMDSAELRIWQVLPLHPIDPWGSPYAADSSVALEPMMLSVDDLVEDGWLLAREKPLAPGPAHRVDWTWVRTEKQKALDRAADRVVASGELERAEPSPALDSYALYKAIKDEQERGWSAWPAPLRDRDPAALDEARDRLALRIGRHRALQWLLARQWSELRMAAKVRGIEIWGDVPFFVPHDSVDVWEAPSLWRLDEDRVPSVVSGVPPDAFSEDGQLWGHPLYDEAAHANTEYAWWRRRMRELLKVVDRVRIDHFRGFEGVWENPADATTAAHGQWVPGPGKPLLEVLTGDFGRETFIAEDLGVITDDVRELLTAFDLPGMAILQFAFDGEPNHVYLPHRHQRNQVCYTGTHDNQTSLGWFLSRGQEEQDRIRRYLAASDRDMPWALMRAAWRSPADTAIVPLQDLLGLDDQARLNLPGTTQGNWSWRTHAAAFTLTLASRVADEVQISGRAASQ
ncbi:MAG: 4-alpha-glucanotransferase [Myxococcota bacterium]